MNLVIFGLLVEILVILEGLERWVLDFEYFSKDFRPVITIKLG